VCKENQLTHKLHEVQSFIFIIMWSCPGNMPKYYSTEYHYRSLHEV